MKEKQGNTVKLIYDFSTEKHLECELNGNWYRVTCRDFRSWNGGRRIISYKDLQGNLGVFFQDYNGPIYYWNTNKIVKNPQSKGVQYISLQFESVLRESEKRKRK